MPNKMDVLEVGYIFIFALLFAGIISSMMAAHKNNKDANSNKEKEFGVFIGCMIAILGITIVEGIIIIFG